MMLKNHFKLYETKVKKKLHSQVSGEVGRLLKNRLERVWKESVMA